jgi:hypothetical protein
MGQPEGEEHRVEAARRPPGEHIRLDELHRQVIGAPAGQGQHLGAASIAVTERARAASSRVHGRCRLDSP